MASRDVSALLLHLPVSGNETWKTKIAIRPFVFGKGSGSASIASLKTLFSAEMNQWLPSFFTEFIRKMALPMLGFSQMGT
jgi:hypothetical protein